MFPGDHVQIVNKRKLCDKAAVIQTPSEATKQDIIRFLDIDPQKIVVIPWGIDKIVFDRSFLPFNKEYLLFVGSRSGYKNFNLLLKDFSLISQNEKDLFLVCTGSPFSPEEINLINQLGLSNKVIQKKVFSQEEMYQLYSHAIALVFPSSCEGFGLPLLEASICGCPLFLNDIACFREIAKDNAIYFTINNESSDFSSVFLDYYHSDTTNQLITKKKSEMIHLNYNWDLCVTQMLECYTPYLSKNTTI